MTSSAEMLGNGGAARQLAVKSYHYATECQRQMLRRFFEAAVPPEDFLQYERTYHAGKIYGDAVTGPFLAQAVVWKCLSKCHRDTGDGHGKWCLVMNSGQYQGGAMYFPDLRLKLASVASAALTSHSLSAGFALGTCSFSAPPTSTIS